MPGSLTLVSDINDYPGHFVPQQYLPDGVNETFYHPSDNGDEVRVVQVLQAQKTIKELLENNANMGEKS